MGLNHLSGVCVSMSVYCSLMSAPPPPEDGILEAVPFSTGRTMTPEEVQQLMQRTVQQV